MNILKLNESSAEGRREFLRSGYNMSAKAVLATLTASLFLTPDKSKAQSGNSGNSGNSANSVADVLNFALTLEHLEDEFYKMALDSNNLIPGSDRAIFAQISKHETAHVAFIKAALGNNASKKPDFDFTAGGKFAGAFSDYMMFLTLAQAFEDTGVRAYKGQAGNLKGNGDILMKALQIHSVEGRHAAEVRWLRAEVTGIGVKPWIENNSADGAPSEVYQGEENLVQAGINLNDIGSIATLGDNVKSRAFDEPLTKEQVMSIVSPFIK